MKKDGCWMNSEIKTFNFKSLNLWEWMVINNEWTVKEMKLDAECIMTAFNWMKLTSKKEFAAEEIIPGMNFWYLISWNEWN